MERVLITSYKVSPYRVIKIIRLTFINIHTRRERTTVNEWYLDYYRSEYESDTLIIVSTRDAGLESFPPRDGSGCRVLSFERRYLADVYESGFVKRAWVLDPNRQGTSSWPRVDYELRRQNPRSNGRLFISLAPFFANVRDVLDAINPGARAIESSHCTRMPVRPIAQISSGR